MNWGAVLFLCALAPRVRGPAGKNGGVSIGTPPFLGESPQFILRGSPFFVRGGGVCGAQCGAMRSFSPTAGRQVPKRLANRDGGRAEAAGSKKICPVTCRQMVGIGGREATK